MKKTIKKITAVFLYMMIFVWTFGLFGFKADIKELIEGSVFVLVILTVYFIADYLKSTD